MILIKGWFFIKKNHCTLCSNILINYKLKEMKRVIILALIVLAVVACRRKSADDYHFYVSDQDTTKVEQADTAQIADAELQQDAKKEEIDRGVDLKNHSYFIVVSTYVVEDFAKEQMKEFAEQGYKPEVFMINKDGWYRLAIESYKTHDEAKEALERLVAKGGLFSNARIVINKNTL